MSNDDPKEWFVYMLCCDNGALYTGVTTDVQRRIGEHTHQGRRAARYTRAFAPVKLVYFCRVGPKRLAYQIEYHLRKLPREKKETVVLENFSKKNLLRFLDT